MTDYRATQVAVEQFATGTPSLQATQAALEAWASVTTTAVQMVATMCAVEMWAPLAQTARAGPRQSLVA